MPCEGTFAKPAYIALVMKNVNAGPSNGQTAANSSCAPAWPVQSSVDSHANGATGHPDGVWPPLRDWQFFQDYCMIRAGILRQAIRSTYAMWLNAWLLEKSPPRSWSGPGTNVDLELLRRPQRSAQALWPHVNHQKIAQA